MSVDVTIVQVNKYLQLLNYFKEGEIIEEDIRVFLINNVLPGINGKIEQQKFLKELLNLNYQYNMMFESVILKYLTDNTVKEEIYYSNTQLSQILDITRKTVHNWKFPNCKNPNNKRLIPGSEIEKFLKGTKYYDKWKNFTGI